MGLSPDVTTYQYNADGQLELATRPDGRQVDYVYAPSGRLAQVVADGGVYALSYDGQGRLAQVTDPSGGSLSYTYAQGVPT